MKQIITEHISCDYVRWRRTILPTFAVLLMLVVNPSISLGQIETEGSFDRAVSAMDTNTKTELIGLYSVALATVTKNNNGVSVAQARAALSQSTRFAGADLKNGVPLYFLKLRPRSNLTPSSSGLMLN